MSSPCTSAMLGPFAFTRGLSPEQLKRLASMGQCQSLPAGTVLVREGNPAHEFYLIQEGQVKLTTRTGSEPSFTVQLLGAGEPLGWSWLLPPHQWHFSAEALQPVKVVVFDGVALRQTCDQDPAFGQVLMIRLTEVINARLRATRLKLLAQMAE